MYSMIYNLSKKVCVLFSRCQVADLENFGDTSILATVMTFLPSTSSVSEQLICNSNLFMTNSLSISVPIQWISVSFSLLAMSWALASHYKTHLLHTRKMRLPFQGLALCFIWRLFTVLPRVLALAVFAIHLGYKVLLGCGCAHFFISFFIYLLFPYRKYGVVIEKRNLFIDALFGSFLALYICFSVIHIRYSKIQHYVFHFLIYLENLCMFCVWYFSTHSLPLLYQYLSSISVITAYVIGVFAQVCYYVDYHPRNFKIETNSSDDRRVGWKEWIEPPKKSVSEQVSAQDKKD